MEPMVPLPGRRCAGPVARDLGQASRAGDRFAAWGTDPTGDADNLISNLDGIRQGGEGRFHRALRLETRPGAASMSAGRLLVKVS